ncbi:WW domain-containing protein [Tricharina praecox]|uniref:WW domain-containing protein n=1 Tax=Tricharina praecox TaxID=43433 RepID=UPI00221EF2F2|nr:WW domain-containing protein [Tricharina praecox]KAI5844179.1 WW domain-containing protein [Tricharina praecox]
MSSPVASVPQLPDEPKEALEDPPLPSKETSATTVVETVSEDNNAEAVPDLAADEAAATDDEKEEGEEETPPLPPGPPPGDSLEEGDDGWQPVWDATYGSYYFYNSITEETTWTNPRVPDATPAILAAVADSSSAAIPDDPDDPASAAAYLDPLQYNPAIHGDYDPTAPYAQPRENPNAQAGDYTVTAAFNRFTGKFTPSASKLVPENFNDEHKSKRQMEFYFDVDAAANSHDGKSLKAERQTRKLSKRELKEFKEKRKLRKEEKRKAWLKD